MQHLLGDHTSPNLQTVRCRWRGCHAFFAKQQSVKEVSGAAASANGRRCVFDWTWTDTSSSVTLGLLLQELPEHMRNHVEEDANSEPEATQLISSS